MQTEVELKILNPKMADKTAPATVIFFPLEDSLRIKLWAVAEASFRPDRL